MHSEVGPCWQLMVKTPPSMMLYRKGSDDGVLANALGGGSMLAVMFTPETA